MLPAAIVILESMPLTNQGKIDRRALPEPGESAAERTGRHVPARDPLEHMIASIWEELLGVRDLWLLGGQSSLRESGNWQTYCAMKRPRYLLKPAASRTSSKRSAVSEWNRGSGFF